ncbi:MAG: hypothetical protein AAB330_03490, partial [Bacteroidota bacterium]
MFENVRLKVGITYSRFHFRKAKDQILRFTEAVHRANSALVILPEAATDSESLQTVLKYLVRRFSSGHLT